MNAQIQGFAEAQKTPATTKRTKIRWLILTLLFIITTINYADRQTLSFAAPFIAKDFHLSVMKIGYTMSAFSWSYVIVQIPGGWLLDHFGSKKVYFGSLAFWSFFTGITAYVGMFPLGIVFPLLFAFRLMLGAAEGPSFPANSRIVAAWFPTHERGVASAIFNSAQYFAQVLFAPVMGIVVTTLGWKHVFTIMGGVGLLFALVILKVLYAPKDHPLVNQAELDYLAQGGALVDLDQKGTKAASGRTWDYVKELLSSRMMLGIYIGQYCITTLTWFFLTWFPIYLIKARHMSVLKVGFVAVLPALAGFLGGILGGMISDLLLKKGCSLTTARKVPIVGGMLLSTIIVACNYTNVNWIVVLFLTLAFFGKGIGALGWAVVSDTSAKEIAGLSGGLFNTFGNTAGIVTPIAIAYILSKTNSFNGALVFVALNAIGAILSYLLIVQKIQRFELKKI
ncbi:MAG: MFS transporter [Holophaga sp.]|nr:MFS transporter [Holophaga sp.]